MSNPKFLLKTKSKSVPEPVPVPVRVQEGVPVAAKDLNVSVPVSFPDLVPVTYPGGSPEPVTGLCPTLSNGTRWDVPRTFLPLPVENRSSHSGGFIWGVKLTPSKKYVRKF